MHRLVLSLAVLQQEPRPGAHVGRGRPRNFPDGVQAIGACYERLPRLEAERVEMRIAGCHVRRVADDQIEALARQRLEPAAVAELDVEGEPYGVSLRNFERRCARLHRGDLCLRATFLDGESNGAGAGT